MKLPRIRPSAKAPAAAAMLIAIVLALVAGGVFSAPDVPTAPVREGEFQDVMLLRGEVRPVRSITLLSPSRGGELRIVRLARNGAMVKAGDPVIEFDRSLVMRTLEEKRSELKSAEAQIDQIRAKRRLGEQQLFTDVQKAQYDVERARLDLRGEDLLSKVDVEQKRLALADARSALTAVEEKRRAEQAAAAAELRSASQKRDKARYEVQDSEQQLRRLTVTAPAPGMVALLPNWRSGGAAGTSPEFREGDRVWPGAAVAELPDLSRVRIAAKLDEIERTRLNPGLAAMVRIDAVADREFSGTLSTISALTKPDFGTWPPARNFEAIVDVSEHDGRIRPGMNATARLIVDRVPHATLVPLQALFDENGRTVAYVAVRGGFETRVVTIARRSAEDAMVASGLRPGETVSLRKPQQQD
jgi:HlyD family secretion protein